MAQNVSLAPTLSPVPSVEDNSSSGDFFLNMPVLIALLVIVGILIAAIVLPRCVYYTQTTSSVLTTEAADPKVPIGHVEELPPTQPTTPATDILDATEIGLTDGDGVEVTLPTMITVRSTVHSQSSDLEEFSQSRDDSETTEEEGDVFLHPRRQDAADDDGLSSVDTERGYASGNQCKGCDIVTVANALSNREPS